MVFHKYNGRYYYGTPLTSSELRKRSTPRQKSSRGVYCFEPTLYTGDKERKRNSLKSPPMYPPRSSIAAVISSGNSDVFPGWHAIKGTSKRSLRMNPSAAFTVAGFVLDTSRMVLLHDRHRTSLF